MSNTHNIKVHYLYHSGFAVETENHFLIFDYYKDNFMGKEKSLENGFISDELIKSKKNILVFVSHSHPDHFNPVILKWSNLNKDIKYIVSNDVYIENSIKNCYKLSKYEDISFKDEGIYIKAFGSTDIGISFLVKIDGITLFHSGDLNLWYWKEDPENERISADINFKFEIEKLKGEKIDVAFFPVDPRLDEYYISGGKYFIENIHPSIFFPMHFWNNYSITEKFKEDMKDSKTQVMSIKNIGETFNLNITN
ncbi:MAG: MBL fold metallo-hydrolase [Thermoanaerobacterium thermosaccharolyticum]|jgi:L-ascorbate metabolism protein UlaG (beta-lactamase superfamily)